MKLRLTLWLAALFLSAMLFQTAAQAAIACTISSSGFTAAYSGAQSINQTSFTVNCTRLLADSSTQAYSVAVDNGLTPTGVNNRAQSGTNRIRYDEYKDSACSSAWKSNSSISGTVTFAGSALSASSTINYWGCVTAGQSVANGTYTDTVTMTLTYGSLTAANTHPVTIWSPAVCNITSAPGTVSFAYTSFRTTDATASTTFGVNCSSTLPYTMAVSPASGTLTGISYSLSLPASSTGTGATQTQTISGTALAGQAGTCATGSCSGTQSTTLTITY